MENINRPCSILLYRVLHKQGKTPCFSHSNILHDTAITPSAAVVWREIWASPRAPDQTGARDGALRVGFCTAGAGGSKWGSPWACLG